MAQQAWPRWCATRIVAACVVGAVWGVAGYALNSEDFQDKAITGPAIIWRLGVAGAVGMLMFGYFGALACLASLPYPGRPFCFCLLALLAAMLCGSLIMPHHKNEAPGTALQSAISIVLIPAVTAILLAGIGYNVARSKRRFEPNRMQE